MADYSALYRLAPFDVSAPKADFFTPLSQIAGQITQNRELGQQAELRKLALQQQASQEAATNAFRQASLGLQSRTNSLAERKFQEEQNQRQKQIDAIKALTGGTPTPTTIGPNSEAPSPVSPGFSDISPLSPQPVASQGAPGTQVAGPPQVPSSPDTAAEVDRLQKALLIPDLPAGAQKYIQERLKTLNPDYNKTPAGAGMIEQAKEEAKASVKAETSAREEEQKAYSAINRYAVLKPLSDKLKTDATFPSRIKMGAFAKGMLGDNAESVLSVLGLKPDDIGNAQAFSAIANQSIAGLIGPGGLLPANNFTEKDRELILSTVPNLGDDPKAIALKIELANRANQLVVQRGDEWRRYKKSHQGAKYSDFLDEWNGQLSARDRFGDIQRQAEDLLKNTQPGGVSAPKNTKASGKLSNGLQWSAE